MRLWTVHPRYLDARGLVALWREGLLAQKVLRGGTRGYTRHPQLTRFRAAPDPPAAIAAYLAVVLEEATRRGYTFDAGKIAPPRVPLLIDETDGQLLYEWDHLLRKLERRDPDRHAASLAITAPDPHPLFRVVPGGVRDWERVE